MISFERSEKEIKEKKEQLLACSSSHFLISRPTATAKSFTVSHVNRIILNAQKGKLRFIRTSVRVLCLLIVRYTSPMPQIFSESIIIKQVGGLFGVWMAQRIKHTTEGVKTLTAFKTLLIINKTNVNIIIISLYSCLFGAWKLKSQSTTSRGVK